MINEILIDSPEAAQQTLQDFGMNIPANYDNLSAAIVLHASPDGNPFAEALLVNADNENYTESLFGLGKKAKAKREEKREARKTVDNPQGFSKIGMIGRKVVNSTPIGKIGQIFQGRKQSDVVPQNKVMETAQANAGENEPKSKISEVLQTIGGLAGGLGNVASQFENKGAEEETGGGYAPSPNEEPKWKKYLPFIIGGGVLVVGVIIFIAMKKK